LLLILNSEEEWWSEEGVFPTNPSAATTAPAGHTTTPRVLVASPGTGWVEAAAAAAASRQETGVRAERRRDAEAGAGHADRGDAD
jgi:hypothetical protein